MYCINCGKKIKDSSNFCEFCGEKIEKQSVSISIDFNKHKSIIKRILIFLVSIFILYNVCYYFFSEDALIKKWTTAYVLNDYKTIVNLSNINKNEFMSDKIITEKYGKENLENVDVKILTSSKGKTHNRTVSWTINDKTKVLNVTVIKNLFGYKIDAKNLVASNVKFICPKNYKLYIDNVLLTDKYINKDKTKDDFVYYEIDSLLKKNVKIELRFDNNIVMYNTRSMFDNEEINVLDIRYNNIDDKSKEKLSSIMKDTLNDIINNISKNNDISKLNKNLYKSELLEDKIFENNYNNIKTKYNNKFSDFKIEEINVSNIRVDKNNEIEVKYNIKYTYKNNYSHDRSRTINLKLDNNLKVVNINISSLLYMF